MHGKHRSQHLSITCGIQEENQRLGLVVSISSQLYSDLARSLLMTSTIICNVTNLPSGFGVHVHTHMSQGKDNCKSVFTGVPVLVLAALDQMGKMHKFSQPKLGAHTHMKAANTCMQFPVKSLGKDKPPKSVYGEHQWWVWLPQVESCTNLHSPKLGVHTYMFIVLIDQNIYFLFK